MYGLLLLWAVEVVKAVNFESERCTMEQEEGSLATLLYECMALTEVYQSWSAHIYDYGMTLNFTLYYRYCRRFDDPVISIAAAIRL